MKLIATLATLAALVGQTQAATVPGTITATHDERGIGVCTDKITLKAVIATVTGGGVITASKKVTWKLPDAFKLEGTFAAATHITSITTGTSVLADGGSTAADAKYTGLAYNATTNQIEYTLPANKVAAVSGGAAAVAGADGDDQEIQLKAVCNYMTTVSSTKYTWTPAGSEVKFSIQGDDDTAGIVTSGSTTATPAAGSEPLELTALKLVEIPTKGATGKVRVEFTANAAAATAGATGKIVLNLPTGYKYKAGAKCKVGPKDAPVEFTAPVGTSDTTVPYAEMALGTPAGAVITAAALAFECDQVISTADAPVPFLGDVSLKYGTAANAATYMGYFKSITASPTKSPTAKAADSPASVATASGVVVGALGVAALFLA